MKRKNFTFCLAVFLLILLTTAMLYFYITRRLRREQCDTVPDPCRPAVAITFDYGPDAEYTPRCWTFDTGTIRRPHFSSWGKMFLKTNCW